MTFTPAVSSATCAGRTQLISAGLSRALPNASLSCAADGTGWNWHRGTPVIIESDITCIIGEPKNDGFRLDLPRIMKLLHTYYRGMKFARALVWSRGLRDLLDVGEEQTDEEIAAQEFTDPKNKVLVIWNWNKRLSRSDYIAAELLNFCDSVHGDSEACADWCRWHGLRLSPQPVMRFGKVVDD